MNLNKNFSIITDFGCPFECYFCITKSQNTKKSFIFDKTIFSKIEVESIGYDRISVSGGGEPLFAHNKEIKLFYEALFNFSKKAKMPIHVHTNLDKPNSLSYMFDKVVVSVNKENYGQKFENWKDVKHKRFVYVSDSKDIKIVQEIIQSITDDSQFTIKQLDGLDLNLFSDIIDLANNYEYVRFLPSGDYNIYFDLNSSTIYSEFKKIKFKD